MNIFKNARVKLTLWYLVIIMVVSAFFSLVVYRGFEKELGRGFRYQAIQPFSEQRVFVQRDGDFTRILPFVIYPEEIPPEEFIEVINLAKKRFTLQLLIINGGILILAGTAGYFLAGKTLHPIEVMVDEQNRFVADASHELRTPLTSIKTEVEVALRNKKIEIKEYMTEVVVNGNPQSLVELISILINNAIKYSTDGKEIIVSVKKDKKHAVIEVSDQGIGIAQKDIPHIFDRFYRADSSRCKKDIDGYGLGLSIAKSIVDIHKGEVKVESKPGSGSKFSGLL